MHDLYCPDCGDRCLRIIETTKETFDGEYKEVRTCDKCDTLVYVVRRTVSPAEVPNSEN